MPHALFGKHERFKTPLKIDGVLFDFFASSYNFSNKNRKEEYRIGVTSENEEFLLNLKQKDENLLLKTNKPTRITPISIVKSAINSYAKAANVSAIFSNTNENNLKTKLKKEFLKEIDYFVNDFKYDKKLQLEIGFGSGRHLLFQAKKNPNVQFIGLEVHTPSIEQVLKQIKVENISNVLLVNYDARLFMEFLKSNSVEKVFVHFPVPWEKKPHRRVYSAEFVQEALRILQIGGTLELRTDSDEYFAYCEQLLDGFPNAKKQVQKNQNLEVVSKYEDRWKKQGKTIYDLILKCNENNDEKKITADFSFEKNINFEEFKQRVPKQAIVNKDFVLHFEDVFCIDENSGLIQVTMGSFNKPVTKYLHIEGGKVRYFQGNPIITSANIKAHTKLKEILL